MIKKIKDTRFGRAGIYESLWGNFYCVSVERPAGNCFSIRAGMLPWNLLLGIPVIPSEIPIECMFSLFPGKQGNHLSYKPC